MSARFWLFSCACAGVALTGGFGLGLYATTQPRPGTETSLPQAVSPDGTGYDMGSADLTGPAIVRCDGCGPTLADRQMAADMAGWDGTLPVSIERFANGESEGSFQPVRIAQAPESRTSAEEAPADAALSY
ncbi:hypothetical protein A0J57_15575 [Sphingobium sp. 22B]|uniref:hypothetical protein n=1 Tax=unclassified Sphingobium TaxID=2611147 RepID=UPI0007801E8F|nr:MULTISPECIES: hypothetical protein [unclassified Sphingobium]KXU30161.1 hypothetical protein AXW74_19275 [Sphingobium sp. AM]KYC31199.1 hypothetical protein A0J57_15575 [Sphingobium sp. 22B]OAP29892.1 hypothetical protein A8O16_21400 [Sphingobium sp. 20006FA]